FRTDRRDRSYLWLSLACLADMFYQIISLNGYYGTGMPMAAENFLLDVVLTPLFFGLWVIFWGYWYGLSGMKQIHTLVWTLVLILILGVAPLRAPLYGSIVPVESSSWLLPLTVALKLCLGAVIVWIVYRGIRLHGNEGWLGVAAVILMPPWLYSDEFITLHLY